MWFLNGDFRDGGTEVFKSHFLDRVVVVLCRPEGSLNIGSVCRCMENMGLSRLSLVGNLEGIEEEHVRWMALHAFPIYQKARHFQSLPLALEGMTMAAGITRRRGKKRKRLSLLPEELASMAAETGEGDIALVFGNEQNGLSDRELAACTQACHIPSHEQNPSLNLSHAVQILAYTFFRQGAGERTGGCKPVSLKRHDELADVVVSCLQRAGYFDKADRFGTHDFFRDTFARARLTAQEADHMEKVFQKLKFLFPKDGGAD